jgi:hypothetical protein
MKEKMRVEYENTVKENIRNWISFNDDIWLDFMW